MLTILRRLRARLRGAAADERGISAVEFGLLAPVMVSMLGGAVELSGGITASNRATYVADAIGEMVSQATQTLTQNDLEGFIRTAALINPDVVQYARQSGKSLETAVDVTVSSVQFELQKPSCTSGCAYDAYVVFSEALSGSKRFCGKLTASDSTSASSLPPDVYSSGSLVVVDVTVRYRPLMSIFLKQDLTFRRSAYFRPRKVARVNSKTNCTAYKVT